MRKTTVPVLILALAFAAFCGHGEAANPFRRLGGGGAGGGMFPPSGALPGLELVGKVLTYRVEKFQEFYGVAGNRYIEYGLQQMLAGEYTWGGKDRRLTVEMSTMDTPMNAAGLFHYHRGDVLKGNAARADVGAEGALDSMRDNRNLYFYRSNIFVKIIYSGKDPVPDIVQFARLIDAKIPGGRDDSPAGLEYIKVPGVKEDTIAVTPGFTFNIQFMPPAVWASAPGGGSVASDLFIITRNLDSEASELYRDYYKYLQMFSDSFEEYSRGGGKFIKAVDPNQGRVVFTAYRNVLIIAARPDGFEKGEALIDAVIARIDELTPAAAPRRRLFGRGK